MSMQVEKRLPKAPTPYPSPPTSPLTKRALSAHDMRLSEVMRELERAGVAPDDYFVSADRAPDKEATRGGTRAWLRSACGRVKKALTGG